MLHKLQYKMPTSMVEILTAQQEQQSKTFCFELTDFRYLFAPTMSTYCRFPGHQKKVFPSSSESIDM